MERIQCMVSDGAKQVLIEYKKTHKHNSLDNALSELLENYYAVE